MTAQKYELGDAKARAVVEPMTNRLRLAAEYITEHGWTQGTEKDEAGRVCLTGAIRYCAPVDGDVYLIRGVLRKRDRAEGWNDRSATTEQEVEGYLRTAEVTDADLEETFGPQWVQIVGLVRRAAVLTDDEARNLGAARDAARTAALGAARDAARTAALGAALGAAWDAALGAALGAAWDAARDAAWALHTRDLIGAKFTPDHYDILTMPWRRTIGRLHPDDAQMKA